MALPFLFMGTGRYANRIKEMFYSMHKKIALLAALLLLAFGAVVFYWIDAKSPPETDPGETLTETETPEAITETPDPAPSIPTLPAVEGKSEQEGRDEEEQVDQPAEEAWLEAYACRDGCEDELSGLAEEPWSLEDAYWLYRAGHPTAEERAYWTGSDAGLHDALQAAKGGNVRAMNTLASHFLEEGDLNSALSNAMGASQRCSPLGARLEAQVHIEMGRAGDYESALIAMRFAYLLGDTTVIPVLYEAADAMGYEMWMLAGPDETALRGMSVFMQRNEGCRHPGFRPVDLG